MTNAAIYARISSDVSGDAHGVTGQVADGRALCEQRDWRVVEVYEDNDLAALAGGPRPRYADLMAAAEPLDVIVVYHLSRLWRNRRERAEGIERLKPLRVSIVSVKGPDLDLSTAYGRSMAGMLGEFDTWESEVKAERVRSHIERNASSGAQMAGGHRPYGYQPHYKVVSQGGEKVRRRITGVDLEPTEAAVVRECARRILAGESLVSVCDDLNRREIVTSAGRTWRTQTMRRMLCSARISGRRQHIPTDSYQGKTAPLLGPIVSDTSEWPAIITHAESDRLRTLLGGRVGTRPGSGTRKLLSGLLVCSRCGRPMVSRPQDGHPRYVCDANPGRGGCGRMYVNMARADERVRDLVLAALDSPGMAERLAQRDSPDDGIHQQIRDGEEALERLAADYGVMTRREWKAARTPILARLEKARAVLSRQSQTSALEGFHGPLDFMQERWAAMNTSQRRAVVTACVESITVYPPRSGGNRFDPDRLHPVWRA
ncbi:MAG: recombinase family protein [Pseudonocardiaceae bacterium]|nr:recombinase family protein [Pseudonocardiaceae bacterium]